MKASFCSGMARFALIATLTVVMIGCGFGVTSVPSAPEATPIVQTITVDKHVEPHGVPHILPAYETAAERASVGKRDAADDYRWDHKEWFAVTEPPEAGRFRPFGEWEDMSAVWTTYSNGMPGTAAVRRMFAEQTIGFLRHSDPPLKAYVIVSSANTQADFLKAVDQYGITADEKKNIVMVGLANQTIWHIDYGPFPLVDRKTGLVAFTDYNYYQPRQIDDAIPTRIATEVYQNLTTYRMPFAFEGGNIQADGNRLCATTNRALSNTGYSALKVRSLLRKWNACDETIIVKDITDDGTGHIDMFFKWTAEDAVLFGRYDDTITLDYDGDGQEETLPLPGKVASDYVTTFNNNQQRMNDNAKLFEGLTASNGKPFTVKRLVMMTRLRDDYGNLPRTFINSTFTNGVNMYPSYTTKSCRDPAGAKCMVDTDCPQGFCAAGKCTPTTKTALTAVGCDEIVKCTGGQECVDDPMKIALVAMAQKEWEASMPEWKHVGLRADTIALWSGAIHCITRTIPKGTHAKAIDDGQCIGGKCACVDGGTKQTCSQSADCVGPKWLCDCRMCTGSCPTGSKCTDDADCSVDGTTVVDGSCQFDDGQSCYGKGTGNACGTLAWEGTCDDKLINYCSKSGEPKSVKCAGTGCCGWSDSESSYTCLSSTQCNQCVPECKADEKGCSALGTHLWECVDDNGCLKRKWTHCGADKSCEGSGATAVCAGGSSVEDPEKLCVAGPDEDAGTTEADGQGGTDGGGTGADSTAGTDAGPVNGDVTQDAGTANPVAPPPKDDGCTASNHTPGPMGALAALLLAALGLIAWRRRSEV